MTEKVCGLRTKKVGTERRGGGSGRDLFLRDVFPAFSDSDGTAAGGSGIRPFCEIRSKKSIKSPYKRYVVSATSIRYGEIYWQIRCQVPKQGKGVEKSSPPSPPKVAINFLANRSFFVHLPFGARGGGERKSFYQFVRAVPVSPPPFPCLDFFGKKKKRAF